jgi:hypothetical protein
VQNTSIQPVVRTRGAPTGKRKLVLPWRPILGGVVLLGAAGAAYLSLGLLHPLPPSPAPDMRSGSILILAPNMRDCRRLSFDNMTGAIKDRGTGECNDASANAAARLGEVSHHFLDR